MPEINNTPLKTSFFPVADQVINKYQLPHAHKLSHIRFDLKKLRRALEPFVFQFSDIHKANKGLCLNHQELASSVKDHFFQVSLTQCPPSMKDLLPEENNDTKISRTKKYRQAVTRRTDFPCLDEHNWNIPSKLFKNSYFYECVNKFKSPAIRVRLTTLEAGKTISPHIDYNVDYAVRIVVPIYTNEKCLNYFWRRGKKLKTFIPADGHPWFLNVGLKHSVENLGPSKRIVLMFSLAGIEDIQHLIQPGSESETPSEQAYENELQI